jgi:hypothetical protein
MLLTAYQQMAFDQLAVKFEGLLRDLCEVGNITVTKIIKDQIVAMDVNDLLQSAKLNSKFDKIDLDFWRYAFTGSGYNIRNNVAHAFYRDSDYTMALANILVMAYIRIAKYGGIVKSAMKNVD